MQDKFTKAKDAIYRAVHEHLISQADVSEWALEMALEQPVLFELVLTSIKERRIQQEHADTAVVEAFIKSLRF